MNRESATDTYLRRATRGLWGRRRREVREELEAHLNERVLAHRIAGLGEAGAVERALAELGNPRDVSAGMMRLYTLPTVMGSGAALAAACVLVVSLLPKGAAQAPVASSFYWPSAECTAALRSSSILRPYQVCEELDNSLWLDPQELKAAFEAQGVTVRGDDETLRLTFPDSSPVDIPVGRSGAPRVTVEGTEKPAVPGSVSLWNLVTGVSEQSDLAVRFEGWDNPVVHIGNASFQLGTELRQVKGGDFYDQYLENVFFRGLAASIWDTGSAFSTFVLNPRNDVGTPLREVELELSGATPGVYGVVTMLDPDTLVGYLPSDADSDVYISVEVVQVDNDSTHPVELPEAPVRFAQRFDADSAAGTAVLVRLSGGFGDGEGWYEVVAPERVTVVE